MSVLIKGMEMPTNCFLCPLSVLNSERLFCEVTKDEVLRSKIPSDCPLVELPPHGRLIDADVLVERLECGENSSLGQAHAYYRFAKAYVKEAPTIIEAEETE